MSSFHSVSAYEYLSAKTTEYGVLRLAILSWSSSMNGVMTMSQSHYNDIVVSTDTYVSGRSVDRNVTWGVWARGRNAWRSARTHGQLLVRVHVVRQQRLHRPCAAATRRALVSDGQQLLVLSIGG